jgi:hypothetical protein
MLPVPPEDAIGRLASENNIWFGSARGDGSPHLAPVWFVYYEGRLYIGTDPHSVKSRNIAGNPRVVLALEGGNHPVICEGSARVVERPYPAGLLEAFLKKYEWDISTEDQYNQVVEISPRKWLAW